MHANSSPATTRSEHLVGLQRAAPAIRPAAAAVSGVIVLGHAQLHLLQELKGVQVGVKDVARLVVVAWGGGGGHGVAGRGGMEC